MPFFGQNKILHSDSKSIHYTCVIFENSKPHILLNTSIIHLYGQCHVIPIYLILKVSDFFTNISNSKFI